MQNAPVEHYAILLTCTKLPPVLKTFVLSIFEWPHKTGFTILYSQIRHVKGSDGMTTRVNPDLTAPERAADLDLVIDYCTFKFRLP